MLFPRLYYGQMDGRRDRTPQQFSTTHCFSVSEEGAGAGWGAPLGCQFPNYRAQTDRKCFDQQQNQSKHSCTKSCSAELSKIGDMSTVLRLPHMDIVLECDHKVRRSRRPGNRERISPRRSDRLRNVSGGNQDHPQQTDTNVRSKRRRYNSVMDDQEDNDNDEDDDQGDKQRQEPEHRQLNRMKMQRQKVMISCWE